MEGSETASNSFEAPSNSTLSRGDFLRGSVALAGGLGFAGRLLIPEAASAARLAGDSPLKYQIAWVGDNGVAGDVVAYKKGWYKAAGLDVSFQPGGPSVDPVTLAGAGASDVSQTSSSPAVFLARSQGIPVKAFAAGLQKHPYAYISLPGNPVKTPRDLIGKTVGIQATGNILLNALLAKNKIDPKQLKIEVIGSDFTPLKTGRVDVMTGWVTNVAAMSILDNQFDTLMLWDSGIHLYANVYLTSDSVLQKRPGDVNKFLAVTARGWKWARDNPKGAIRLLVEMFPADSYDAELAALKKLLTFMWTPETLRHGWGSMHVPVWQNQIDIYKSLGQFQKAAPSASEVVTIGPLNATVAQRAHASLTAVKKVA